MNITLSIDKNVVKQARETAKTMGKSLNQLVREYLEGLTTSDDAETEIIELKRLSSEGNGRSGGWRFDREQLHERS